MSTAVAERTDMGMLPTSSDSNTWDEREQALALQLGLAVQKGNSVEVADRGTVEAFLAHCERTKLDPIARQIYIIKRGNKWQTQISIDGARLVAERTGAYEGQTPVEWSGDGKEWVQAWAEADPPRFARAGVYKRGFREALYTVARWESYAVYTDVWVNNRKTGEQKLSPMWAKMPDLMLGKVAEMLALRKAFPMDLSGLYSTEEMQQADAGRVPRRETVAERAESAAIAAEERGGDAAESVARAEADRAQSDADEPVEAEVVEEPTKPAYDQELWAMRLQQCTTVEQLRPLWDEAEQLQILGEPFDDMRLGDVILGFKRKLETGQ